MPRKKPKKTTLRNKADRLFSLYIRGRDKVCVRCLTTENLQCAHIFSRRYLQVRWDEDNAVALCAGCHKYFTERPIEWEDFILGRTSEEAYRSLRQKAVAIGNPPDYEGILVSLESLTRSLEK